MRRGRKPASARTRKPTRKMAHGGKARKVTAPNSRGRPMKGRRAATSTKRFSPVKTRTMGAKGAPQRQSKVGEQKYKFGGRTQKSTMNNRVKMATSKKRSIRSTRNCEDCYYDYTDFGSECCDSAWYEFSIDCTTLESTHGWDCSGCICPGEANIEGCINPLAENYNPDATIDDGSCEYEMITDDECSCYLDNGQVPEDLGTCNTGWGPQDCYCTTGIYFDNGVCYCTLQEAYLIKSFGPECQPPIEYGCGFDECANYDPNVLHDPDLCDDCCWDHDPNDCVYPDPPCTCQGYNCPSDMHCVCFGGYPHCVYGGFTKTGMKRWEGTRPPVRQKGGRININSRFPGRSQNNSKGKPKK